MVRIPMRSINNHAKNTLMSEIMMPISKYLLNCFMVFQSI